ncbi:MAG TPA: ABC transporter ATP-binding protein [Thermosynergistes sp.]|nr:ABC transporter ATP-binding protein [Thermosynergistes sp.]
MTLLETINLSCHFGGLKAVDNVSLQVGEGEIFGIIGPNGAGKTTLFNMLTGYLEPTSGHVRYRGNNITGLPPQKICKMGIARTFQNIKLFKYMSVLDNVKIGFHIHTSTALWDAIFRTSTYRRDEEVVTKDGMALLERVGLDRQAFNIAASLPYGMQRRLEIARALATGPSLLLLDEPAAGMNPKETEDIMNLIGQLNEEGITIVVIEHDMRVIMSLCHNIAVLDHGVKICEGPPEHVRRHPDVIRAYLGHSVA